jgi:hypothetical protein
MVSRWLRLSQGIALSLSLALAACDQHSGITTPSALTPQASPGAASGLSKKEYKQVMVAAHDGNSWLCDVGPGGDTCTLPDGSVSLTIPKKTVGATTKFEIRLLPGDKVEVQLTATTPYCWFFPTEPGCSPNNVGSAGFRNPITLRINKFGAVSTDPNGRIIIGQKISDTEFVPQPSTDTGDSVTAQVWHFSDYTLLND